MKEFPRGKSFRAEHADKSPEEAIAAHVQIGVIACRLLRDEGPGLHSRKLRAFK